MRIVICGSLRFFNEMNKIRFDLENSGHEVILPVNIEGTNYENKSVEQGVKNIKNYDLINKHYKEIINSDGILVLNLDKGGIKNYIGGNSFLEMGFAYVNNKKIFLFNESPQGLNYCEEILGMDPIILNGDLNKIK